VFAIGAAAAATSARRFVARLVAAALVGGACSLSAAFLMRPANVADFESRTSAPSVRGRDIVEAAIEDLRRQPPGSRFPKALRERVVANAQAIGKGSGIVPPDRDVPGGYYVQTLSHGWKVWFIDSALDAPQNASWTVDASGKPQGLSEIETEERASDLKHQLDLNGDLRIDPTTGDVADYMGDTWSGEALGSKRVPTSVRTRAVAECNQWADRLRLGNCRRLLRWTFWSVGSARGRDRDRQVSATAEFQIGYDGYFAFDGGHVVEVTVQLDDNKLLRVETKGLQSLCDPPKLLLDARQAQARAEASAGRAGLGLPIVSINLAKGSRPAYAAPDVPFAHCEAPPGEQARLRLAWRVLFERGSVDVDAADGKILAVRTTESPKSRPLP
jgi:hypothetical protein